MKLLKIGIICIDWLTVIISIVTLLYLKGLYKYHECPSNYIITFNFFDDQYKFLKTLVDTKINYFAAITAILSAFISLAIPLSINQISNCLKDYNDKDISEMFFKEHVYFQMLSVLTFLLLSLVIWYYSKNEFIIGILLLSFVILTLYYFYQFFSRVIRYITATDDVVHDYFHNNAIKLFDFD